MGSGEYEEVELRRQTPILIISCREMTIKHSKCIYGQYPSYIQKGPVWFFAVLKFPLSIQKTVTFLDPGCHKMKQEEFDGDIKDRPKTYIIKGHQKIGIILCG